MPRFFRKGKKEQKWGNSLSFQKECVYRNPASGTYYALVKVRGKQIKSCLGTQNLPEVRRKLKDCRNEIGRVDPAARKITVAALADLYLATVECQAPTTVRKKDIAQRIKTSGALWNMEAVFDPDDLFSGEALAHVNPLQPMNNLERFQAARLGLQRISGRHEVALCHFKLSAETFRSASA